MTANMSDAQLVAASLARAELADARAEAADRLIDDLLKLFDPKEMRSHAAQQTLRNARVHLGER